MKKNQPHKISIYNLGPIKKIENFEVKKVNLVIGESASGKSLMARAINLFNDLPFALNLGLYKNPFFIDYFSISPMPIDFESLYKNPFTDYFSGYRDYTLKYFYQKDLHIEIKFSKKYEINFSDNLKSLLEKTIKIFDLLEKIVGEAIYFDKSSEEIYYYKENKKMDSTRIKEIRDAKEELLKLVDSDSFPELFPASYKRIKESGQPYWEKPFNLLRRELGLLNLIFIPDNRSFVSDFDELRLRQINRHHDRLPMKGSQVLRNFSNLYRDFLHRFKQLDEENYQELMRGKVSKDDASNKITFSIGNQKLDISHVSSGQKELFPILMILQRIVKEGNPCLLIIEEPEAHLFPKDQRRIFDLLIETINQTDSHIFITTHSPYMLMSANNLMEAKKRDYHDLENRYIDSEKINVHKLDEGTNESLIDKDDFIDGEYIEKVVDEICDEHETILKSKD